jgi:hypothetical protein
MRRLIVGFVLLWGAPVFAQDVHQCIAAHGRMQELEKTSKLLAAREAASACGARACPKEVQVECAEFERKMDRLLPKLVVRVSGVEAGGTGFVEIDGEIALPRLEERPVAVDPGEHAVRVELGDGRSAESRVRVAAGETRTVDIAVAPAAAPPNEPDPGADAPLAEPGLPPEVWIAGGIGVVGVLAGSYFGLRAISLKNDSEEHCPEENLCSAEGVRLRDDAQSAATISTIAFAVGVAGLGTAVTLIVLGPSSDGRGAVLRVGGEF